jgi:hypothetical protein
MQMTFAIMYRFSSDIMYDLTRVVTGSIVIACKMRSLVLIGYLDHDVAVFLLNINCSTADYSNLLQPV